MFGALVSRGAARRWPVRGLSVPIAASLSLLALVGCSSDRPPTPSATSLVSRATVSTGVSASGSLTAINTQDVGFSKGGQLKSVKVKVGDHVNEGQTLATIDDFALKENVSQQEANVDQQEAVLDRLEKNPSLAGGRSTLSQANDVLAATKHQVSATAKADDSAIHRARKQLAVAEDAEDQAQDAVAKLNDQCKKSQQATPSAGALKALSDQYEAALAANDTTAANAALAALTALQTSVASSAAGACSGVASAESGSTSATQGVAASRTALEAAKQRKKVDAAAGQLSIENTRQGVVAAQNAVNSTGSDRPFTIDQQRALVDSAKSLLDTAQHDLDDATLEAPFAGTVSAINGTVGEYLSPSTGTTALAPGSGAAIPGVDSAAGGGAGASGGASATRPGGSQFLVISNINRLQVVLPFEESDAAQIKPKRKVSVTVDAVPDLIAQGTVSSVAPTGTAISGVINYYVTVRLDTTDPRLKDGQTARATVVTQQRKDVLSVPNDAVRRQGADSAVVVVDPSGAQRTVTFKPGVAGPDLTEVVSGLDEGQRVVSPTGH